MSGVPEAAEGQPEPPSEAQPAVDAERLQRLLGDPGLDWLLGRLRRRLENGRPLTGTVGIDAPTPEQRTAVERLLGRRPGAGGRLTVRLDAVEEVLRRSGVSPDGLEAAVLALHGPVVPHAARRAQESAAWEAALAPLDALRHPALVAWARTSRADGLVRRVCRTPQAATRLVAQAVAVLAELPVEPPVSLATFAARTAGGAHALDFGTPLGALVLSGARALANESTGSGAAWRRRVWAGVGLLLDDLSSTVLALNLPHLPGTEWATEQGEPTVLTLRHLTHHPPTSGPAVVHVCENPAVLAAAADTFGPACRPLVCVQGQPSAAALTLLRHLVAHGTELRYHGDFDWGGLRIAAHLGRHVPWRPWRYTAADYRAAAAGRPGGPLTGASTPTPWEPELAEALEGFGVRVEEESVLEELLGDLLDR